jgi:hypothetical protein
MLNIKYIRFKEIDFEHEYYADKKSKDFVLSPTQESLTIMKEYDLLFKQSNGMVTILRKSFKENGVEKPSVSIDKDLKLTFITYFQNDNLLKISDLEKSKQFYLHNGGGRGERLTTKIGGELSANDQLNKLKSQHFTYSFEKNKIKKIEIVGQVVFENLENQEDIEVKLLNSGSFEWKITKIDNSVTSEKIYFDTEIATAKPFFAIIDIFIPQGDTTYQNFTTTIKTITQKWLYFLLDFIPKNPNDESTFSTNIADYNLKFDAIDFQKINDNSLDNKKEEIKKRIPNKIKDVHIYKSNELIKLQEKDTRKTVFKKDNTNKLDDLPQPSIDNFVITKISNESYSTIFFNI